MANPNQPNQPRDFQNLNVSDLDLDEIPSSITGLIGLVAESVKNEMYEQLMPDRLKPYVPDLRDVATWPRKKFDKVRDKLDTAMNYLPLLYNYRVMEAARVDRNTIALPNDIQVQRANILNHLLQVPDEDKDEAIFEHVEALLLSGRAKEEIIKIFDPIEDSVLITQLIDHIKLNQAVDSFNQGNTIPEAEREQILDKLLGADRSRTTAEAATSEATEPSEPTPSKPLSNWVKGALGLAGLAGATASYVVGRGAFRLTRMEVAEIFATSFNTTYALGKGIVNAPITLLKTPWERIQQGFNWGVNVIKPELSEFEHLTEPEYAKTDGGFFSRNWARTKNLAKQAIYTPSNLLNRTWNGTKNLFSQSWYRARQTAFATVAITGMALGGAVEGVGYAAVNDVIGYRSAIPRVEEIDDSNLIELTKFSLADALVGKLDDAQIEEVLKQDTDEYRVNLASTMLTEKNIDPEDFMIESKFIKVPSKEQRTGEERFDRGILGGVTAIGYGGKRMLVDRPYEAAQFFPLTIPFGQVDVNTGVALGAWASLKLWVSGLNVSDTERVFDAMVNTNWGKAMEKANREHPKSGFFGKRYQAFMNLKNKEADGMVKAVLDFFNMGNTASAIIPSGFLAWKKLLSDVPEDQYTPRYPYLGSFMLANELEEVEKFVKNYDLSNLISAYQTMDDEDYNISAAIDEPQYGQRQIRNDIKTFFGLQGRPLLRDLQMKASDMKEKLDQIDTPRSTLLKNTLYPWFDVILDPTNFRKLYPPRNS